jgi:hypothetical protein
MSAVPTVPPPHRGEQHEQGSGFEKERQEKAGKNHEGKEAGQAVKEEERQVIVPAS